AHAEDDSTLGAGSTDMGDVSHVLPAIHPYIGICAPGEAMCHDHAFTAKAASDQGISAMVAAAKAMALTALDLLRDGDLRAAVRDHFDRGRGAGAGIVP